MFACCGLKDKDHEDMSEMPENRHNQIGIEGSPEEETVEPFGMKLLNT